MSVQTLEHAGCSLSYSVRGNGPPVVMIQGVGVQGGAWRPQVDAMAGEYRCLTFDNRGMAQSQPLGPAPLTVEQMAEDVVALMDAQAWPAAHVIGHSLGGLVAIHLALAHRDRVRSLSLLNTFADGRIPNRLSARMLWVGLRTRIGSPASRRRAFLQLIMPPEALKDADTEKLARELAPLFGHDLADQPPVTMKQLAAMKRYDATPRLNELRGLPTLIVSAAHDPIAPPHAGRAIAAGIEGSHLVEIPDASHGVPLHLPARINALILEHLCRIDAHVPTSLPGEGSTWMQDA